MRKVCAVCGSGFETKSPAGKYCGERCKKRAQRGPKLTVVELPVAPPSADASPPAKTDANPNSKDGPVTAATRKELDEAGRLDTALGQAALFIAQRIDFVGLADTGSGVAALLKEHRTALAEAVKDAETDDDPIEAIRRSAAIKLVSGGAR
jgi:hypothetical protein